MIPGLLAEDLARALREFIVTGFETDTWPFAGKFEQLVNTHNKGEAFIKGPYVSISLPFTKSTQSRNFFAGFTTEHSPFDHQLQAWKNLAGGGPEKSTIIATGTGSGKTECYLYPLLDHCQKSTAPGIKAIVIYPMNALADDQAKRFAEVIHAAPELRGSVRVGLFVGGEGNDRHMGAKHAISCKNTLRKNPPDILLTNYRMLDFLLMRPKDQPLWQQSGPDLLKYLVVDELHTFDGAQGSDLAMLIRRLKARLGVATENLVCVGTSATLGSSGQADSLAEYASNIFDARFDSSSIIGESREPYEKFLGMIEHMVLDPSFSLEELRPDHHANLEAYLIAQARLFFGDDWSLDPRDPASREALGRHLRKHLLLHNLLYVTQKGPVTVRELLPLVQKQLPPRLKSSTEDVLISLLALLSHARGERYPEEPLVTLRLQLWARELRRIVARAGPDTAQKPVQLLFSDDLKSRDKNKQQGAVYLPVVQCSECHTTAWLTSVAEGAKHIEQDLQNIYTHYFSRDKRVRVLLPLKDPEHRPPFKGLVRYLCSDCGHLQGADGSCRSCGQQELVTVFEPDLNRQVRRGGIPTLESQQQCPVCQASNSLILFGARAASLSSVAIHQMFASKTNDDKKLIAFSDSVQDAAHRAGFFAARTWQNNIRMALAKAVKHLDKNRTRMPLTEFFDYLPRYWLTEPANKERLNRRNFIIQFIPPHMQTDDDYVALKQHADSKGSDRLVSQIKERLTWETLSEFGMRSRIGRSLERTGVATVFWDPALIERAAETLIADSSDRLDYALPQANARYLLWGIALRMKRQGAIYNRLLDGFIKNGGEYFVLNRLSGSPDFAWLPKFGTHSVLPKFPAEEKEKGLECIFSKKQGSWYSRWTQLQLDDNQLTDNHFIDQLLSQAMQVLVRSGLLLEKQTKKEHRVWALNPDQLFMTADLGTVQLRDDLQNAETEGAYGSWQLPVPWIEPVSGMPSLDHAARAAKGQSSRAAAVYEPGRHARKSMYRDFYIQGEIRRVISHEHTALLERKEREDLERRFMAGRGERQDWYENLLSATPTLEMGIDIGDLSSVLLCSVPPRDANYLQRAGRGGRKDGNSFILTLANGRPHDLYFYADPLRMLAGDVESPAIFLNAVMVLRRQLLAFCIDSWGLQLAGQHLIPGSMQPVLDAVEKGNMQGFPYTLLDYIGRHRDELWEGFSKLLNKSVSDDTRDKLKSYLLGTGDGGNELRIYILNKISQVVEERRNFVQYQKGLQSELRRSRKKPRDEAREKHEEELARELEGIKQLKTDLNRKDTFNFFTDDGLLPNYAFPEEGTTLHSVIFRRTGKSAAPGAGAGYKSRIFEYARPAHAALSELAPESIFYAGNRKVRVERVEMARGRNLERWRLCPACSYSKHIPGPDSDTACPRCGDPMWANVSQLMYMVKLRQVYASTSEDKAFIGDESDTREPTFYNRQMLIDFDRSDIAHAYAMKTEVRPFGFEFIKKVRFREINFGRKGGTDQVFRVAGAEMARPGFRLCSECGMVQQHQKSPQHLFKCKYRKQSEGAGLGELDPGADGIRDYLYLYREYESEAVRILMPRISLAGREEQIQSFIAALQLGLKSQFGGRVDHLNITVSDEPIQGSDERVSYLVLYDTVPGGTGYLHTLLADPSNLMGMLEKSRRIMAECDCQNDPEMDGCYNCLYAHRNSYGMENTSRTAALNILGDILDQETPLEKVDHLETIDKNIWLGSELERRFPEAIQALNRHPLLEDVHIRVSKDIVNGKAGFMLEVGDLIYSVEPQAHLNEKQGVAYPCQPDFLMTLDRKSEKKIQVAVFLDGYLYHKDIIQDDLMKRQGIFSGTGILTWSLTWYDVNSAFAGNEREIPNVLRQNTANAPMDHINEISGLKKLDAHTRIAEMSPMVMLFKFLAEPNIDTWKSYAALRSLCWLNRDKMQDAKERQNFNEAEAIWPSQFTDSFADAEIIFCSSQQFADTKEASLSLFVAGEKAAVTELDPKAIILSAVFDAGDMDAGETRQAWQKLLQILNLGQFLPRFFAGTRQGMENGDFARLRWGSQPDAAMRSEWDRIIELADESTGDIIRALADASAPLPEVGYELVDAKGTCIAEAELAWEDMRVAFMLECQLEAGRDLFERNGWDTVTREDGMDALLSRLGTET